jgi:hypothetical protein
LTGNNEFLHPEVSCPAVGIAIEVVSTAGVEGVVVLLEGKIFRREYTLPE